MINTWTGVILGHGPLRGPNQVVRRPIKVFMTFVNSEVVNSNVEF